MPRKVFYLLVVISFLLISVTVFAQQRETMKPGKEMIKPGVISPAFRAKIAPAGAKLKSIESRLSRIEAKKLVKEGDGEALEKEMYEYAEAMKAAFDEALKDAEKAAKSEGKRGNIESLKTFEGTAKSHETRLKGVEAKTKTIEAQIKRGVIKLDKPVLQKMTPAEREEFQKFLAPEGLKEMQKLHPDLFKPGMKTGSSLNLFNNYQVSSATGFYSSLPEQISNFFMSPAEASTAASCIPPCIAKNWAECAGCIAGKGQPEAIAAWNSFVSCWNGCCSCKWYKPWCCVCKALCLVKLIAKLA